MERNMKLIKMDQLVQELMEKTSTGQEVVYCAIALIVLSDDKQSVKDGLCEADKMGISRDDIVRVIRAFQELREEYHIDLLTWGEFAARQS